MKHVKQHRFSRFSRHTLSTRSWVRYPGWKGVVIKTSAWLTRCQYNERPGLDWLVHRQCAFGRRYLVLLCHWKPGFHGHRLITVATPIPYYTEEISIRITRHTKELTNDLVTLRCQPFFNPELPSFRTSSLKETCAQLPYFPQCREVEVPPRQP